MSDYNTPRNIRVDVYNHPNTDEMSACYVVRTNIDDDPPRQFEIVKCPDGRATWMETTKSVRRI